MSSTYLQPLLFGLLLAAGECFADASDGIIESGWTVSSDGPDGTRRSVIRQRARGGANEGLVVLCDERDAAPLVMIEFPEPARFDGEGHRLETVITVMADGVQVLPDETGSSIRSVARPGSLHRILRSNDAMLLVRTLTMANRVEIGATSASRGATSSRVVVDATGFGALLQRACPWTAEQLARTDAVQETIGTGTDEATLRQGTRDAW